MISSNVMAMGEQSPACAQQNLTPSTTTMTAAVAASSSIPPQATPQSLLPSTTTSSHNQPPQSTTQQTTIPMLYHSSLHPTAPATAAPQPPTTAAAATILRFYANWAGISGGGGVETGGGERGTANAAVVVQRTLTMRVTRLVLEKSLGDQHLQQASRSGVGTALVLSVRLQGHRRSLRCTDINLAHHPHRLDTPLDISFTIQYCHFLKRKPNILQLALQRRKKYKNRQIPGFKTLALGHLNLDEVLQFGGQPREVTMWDTASISSLNSRKAVSSGVVRQLVAGTIHLAQCNSHALDLPSEQQEPKASSSLRKGPRRPVLTGSTSVASSSGSRTALLGRPGGGKGGGSDEEPEEESSDSDSDGATIRSSQAVQRRNKKRRNLKQKMVALLRRIRIPTEIEEEEEEEGEDVVATVGEVRSSRSSRIMPPTEKEIEEIFEELENISDSGPELEPDKVSIVSAPRPRLRPYFGSKLDLPPAIDDDVEADQVSEAESEYLDELVDELSSGVDEPEPPTIATVKKSETMQSLSNGSQGTPKGLTAPFPIPQQTATGNGVKRGIDMLTQLLASLEDRWEPLLPSTLCICSSAELPWLEKLLHSPATTTAASVSDGCSAPAGQPLLLDCPSQSDVKAVMQAVIGRIQNFCNSNSISPLSTNIMLLGGDRLVAHLLRAYVDLLQQKTSAQQDWLIYLRFQPVTPSNSTLGKLLTQLKFTHAWQLPSEHEGFWTRANDMSLEDLRDGLRRISTLRQPRAINLPIGEAMLQQTASNDGKGGSQLFLPFLTELNLVTSDESGGPIESAIAARPPVAGSQSQHTFFSSSSSSLLLGQSPPSSPRNHSQQALLTSGKSLDHGSTPSGRELQIEYWTQQDMPQPQSSHSPLNSSTTSNSGGGGGSARFSTKASVRSLSIGREPTSSGSGLLSCIWVVKEKRKDKMLQKLGRKPKLPPRAQTSITPTSSIKSTMSAVSSPSAAATPPLTEAGFQSRVVASVSRVVCSATKQDHHGGQLMDVLVDGVAWRGVKFFQVSSQWPTHVKLFPVIY